ncbi:hypothetical protein [Pseudonocardia spinosispora]|nr:hypothetical protein [Pseudonocardia spinosispora]
MVEIAVSAIQTSPTAATIALNVNRDNSDTTVLVHRLSAVATIIMCCRSI